MTQYATSPTKIVPRVLPGGPTNCTGCDVLPATQICVNGRVSGLPLADQNVANDNDTLAVTVAAAPPPAPIGGGSGGGGGGGGRFDYLLLALLTLYTIRTASLRRRLPVWASALGRR